MNKKENIFVNVEQVEDVITQSGMKFFGVWKCKKKDTDISPYLGIYLLSFFHIFGFRCIF